jgi:hypothetical protein
MAIYVYTDEFIREPWENTVAYRPLTSVQQTDDLSGNGHTLTLKDMYSYNTYLWVDSLEINWVDTSWDHWVYAPLADSELTNTFTISAYMDWCCVWNWEKRWQWQREIGRYWVNFWGKADNKTWMELNNNSLYKDSVTNTTTGWTYCVLTYDNWDYKIYVNGSLWKSWNHVRGAWRDYMWIGTIWWTTTYISSWHISNVIIEKRVRTAQEISDYFNGTKSNYWIQ